MSLRTRVLSLVLSFGMMLSILPPPGAFAVNNASGTSIEMSDVISLEHDGDNAKYGYPIGSGMDHKTDVSGTGWHYDGSTETLYLESGYTFSNSSTKNYHTACNVVNSASLDGWDMMYGNVTNNGAMTNAWIHPDSLTNGTDGVISTCRIGERAYDYTVENNGTIEYCDFIGDGYEAPDSNLQNPGSTANTLTLTGSGTVDHCSFKSKTAYPGSNTITNSAFLNNQQDLAGMRTIRMADGESGTKLYAVLYDCNSGYGVSGLETIGFVGKPSLYVAGETSYGSARQLASVNGKAIGTADIPGVEMAKAADSPATVLFATSNGFALTPDGTEDITLSQVVAPASNPSPDGTLVLDENGVPVYTSGNGWSYEPKVLYDYQGTRLALVIKANASITLAGNQLVSVPVYLENNATLEGGVYTEEVYLSYTSTLKNATLLGGYGGEKTTTENMIRFSYPDGADLKIIYSDGSAYSTAGNGSIRLPIGAEVEMTVPSSAEDGFAGWVPMELVPVSDYRSVYQRMDAIPGQDDVDLTSKTLKFKATEQLNELAFRVDHTITVINNCVTLSNADGDPITTAAQWEKVYLTPADTTLSAEEFFKNVTITDNIKIQTDTDGKYYFTMPDSGVTISNSSSTDPSDPSQPSQPSSPSEPSEPSAPSEPSQPSEPAEPSEPVDVPAVDAGDPGPAIVLGTVAAGGAAYLIGTQIWLETNLPKNTAIPTSRQQLADLLWNAAGRPEPASAALYPDISAEAADSQKAARWCVEQGLLTAQDGSFAPDRYPFRPQVIRAWNQLQKLLRTES